jgi:BlaI family transcriptional regulator, penicillinase repressor
LKGATLEGSKKKYMSSLRTTDSELEILEILWETGTATVRQVNEELEHKGKNVGYTTTLKMMQIMTEKGLLDREMDGRTHVYRPLIQAGAARNAMIDRVANAAFGGSAMRLVLQALGNHKATPEELSEIKALIDSLEKDQNKGHHGNQ